MKLKVTLTILLTALFIFSLSTGHAVANFSQSMTALYLGDGPLGTVMREIRLPRAMLAVLVGASGLSAKPSCRARFDRCLRVCCIGRSYCPTYRFCDLCLDGFTYCIVFFCHHSSIGSFVVSRPSRKLLDPYSGWNCGKRLSRRIYFPCS